MKWIVLIFCVLPSSTWAKSHHDELIAATTGKRVSLLELFSSEGCDSCPPADAWFSQLRHDQGLWKNFVPVVFHVDYWDYLGWKDKFADKRFTLRQIQESQRWPTPRVYTPGVILNGREWTAWQKQQQPEASSETTGSLKIFRVSEKKFRVEYEPAQKLKGPVQLHLTLLLLGVHDKIQAGENSGKNLRHDFVVNEWQSRYVDSQKMKYIAEFTVKSPDADYERKALAAWVDQGEAALQATGGFL